jgi:shikimate kinase
MVVATGGGAVLKPENRANLKASGFVAYLNVPPHFLHERIRHDKSRPLLQVEDPLARLKELHAQRDPLYREVADLVIDSSRLNAQTVALLLIKELGDQWKL